jgi:hypothetical protein
MRRFFEEIAVFLRLDRILRDVSCTPEWRRGVANFEIQSN